MTRWVMLLRGINVGGAHALRMADLRALLETLGAERVATYIQSGNVILSGPDDAPAFEETVARAIERAHGFCPRVLMIAEAAFRAIVAAYPYPEAREAPKSGHVWFLAAAATPDREALAALAAGNERYTLAERAFYLHAPDGIGRSKLAEKVESLLGVAATARNLRTCHKLVAMLDASADR